MPKQTCKECGGDLELGVVRGPAGWYLSYHCPGCGRTKYFGSHEEALGVILGWLPEGERQEFLDGIRTNLVEILEGRFQEVEEFIKECLDASEVQ